MNIRILNERTERFTFNDDLILTITKPSFLPEGGEPPAVYHLDSIDNKMIRMLLVMNGELGVTIDYIKYKFPKNMLVEIPAVRLINSIEIPSDLHCYDLLFSRSFVEDTLLGRKPIPMSHFMDVINYPGTSLSDKNMTIIKNSILRILYYLQQENHHFKKELLHNTFYNLILEIGNILINMDGQRSEPQKISHKDKIIREFVLLMDKYGKQEHAPSFYSDKLCISTQYLSLILKERSGFTAGHWIASYLVTQAKIQLRIPGITMQAISDELHFADQASFGKFFKKHTGVSPRKYKEDYAIL